MTARNDRCPCGSGKKYRICCGRLDVARPAAAGLAGAVDLTGAAANVGSASASEPGRADLGVLHVLTIAGRHVELEAKARELLIRWPACGYAWQCLGMALGKQGKDPILALERATQCRPDDAAAHVNLGNALGRAGRVDAAAASFQRALSIDAACAEAHNNLADVQTELGHFELAAQSARRALEVRPDFAEAHNTLGNALAKGAGVLRRAGRLEEAVSAFREASSRRPDSVPILIELATALRLLGNTQECEAVCGTALALDANCAAALMVLAELRADCGDFQQAEESFKRAMALDPRATDAVAGLASVRRMTAADAPWLAQALQLLNQSLPPPREVALRFAIGKYYDDTEDFDRAFPHYRRANELARESGPRHDRRLLTQHVDLIIRSFDREWLSRARGALPGSARAVFVAGTLRSGSSLTEQILSAHRDVHGAGELMFWAERLGPVVAKAAAERVYKIDVNDRASSEWGDRYLELLQRLSGGHPRVIDKLPTNFWFLGPIHASLPDARIIHVQRDPIDTCLSIYFQRFEAANTYANDLEDLAHYYLEYRRVMGHWRAVLPAHTLLEVAYEALVQDPETWSRRMVEFLGLPWDPSCLEFDRNPRAVRTASRWQVRQKISTRSVGRWRHYEKFVEPLKQLLQDESEGA